MWQSICKAVVTAKAVVTPVHVQASVHARLSQLEAAKLLSQLEAAKLSMARCAKHS